MLELQGPEGQNARRTEGAAGTIERPRIGWTTLSPTRGQELLADYTGRGKK
jgi:hypothetical protein